MGWGGLPSFCNVLLGIQFHNIVNLTAMIYVIWSVTNVYYATVKNKFIAIHYFVCPYLQNKG